MRAPALLLAGLLLGLALTAGAWDAARIRAQSASLPAAAQAKLGRLLDLVDSQRGQPAAQQLELVNRFVNQQLAWKEDSELWGVADFWASPLQLFAKQAGDCEDLAMAKYFALVGLGLPESSLRLVYVRAQWQGRAQAHMVLAWYPEPNAEPWILDNLDPELKRVSQRPDLQPVFSFNAQGLWQGAGETRTGNPMTRLTIWRDALSRARAEGF